MQEHGEASDQQRAHHRKAHIMASNTVVPATRRELTYADLYCGTLEQIVATGFAAPEEFPGAAGSRPYTRRYFALDEGEIPWKKRHWGKEKAGDRTIDRDSKNRYRLYVTVSDEVKAARIRMSGHQAEASAFPGDPHRLEAVSILDHVSGRKSPFSETLRTAEASLLDAMLEQAQSSGDDNYREYVRSWIAAAHTERLIMRLRPASRRI